MKPATSIYLHIPFCTHRCAYCDFNTYSGQEALIPAYVSALCEEIHFVGEHAPRRLQVHTIFFGGGTPSLLSPAHFEAILSAIHSHFDLTDDTEITIEANPGTCTFSDLLALRRLGINRLSFGAQSAHPEELRLLERQHDYFEVIRAVAWARRAGFDNLNLDLIYGLPQQPLDRWQATVKLAVGLRPEHLSLYALTLEHGTPFGHWAARGLLPVPDPDLAAEMYEYAEEFLASNGYVHYEISNWAQNVTCHSSLVSDNPTHACRHNLQYWRSLPYLGLGAGAHGYANGIRYSNVLRIKTYIERLMTDRRSLTTDFPLTPATVNHHRQTLHDEMSEFMLMGLRLTREGISASTFQERFGLSLGSVFGREIDELAHLGLLERVEEKRTSEVSKTPEVIRLTSRGRLLGNQVFMRFVS